MKMVIAGIAALVMVAGCAQLGIHVVQQPENNAEIFQMAGFTAEEAEWMSSDLDKQGAKTSLDDAKEFRKKCYANQSSLAELHGWIEGRFSFHESLEWASRGFLPVEAVSWKNAGYSPEQAAEQNERQSRAVRDLESEKNLAEASKLKKIGFDSENEKSLKDLMRTNPFAIKGQYFYLGEKVEAFQLLDRYSGLYKIGYSGFLALLKFNPRDAIPPSVHFSCRAIGAGAYQYQSVFGLQIVPVLKVVTTTDWKSRETTYIPQEKN